MCQSRNPSFAQYQPSRAVQYRKASPIRKVVVHSVVQAEDRTLAVAQLAHGLVAIQELRDPPLAPSCRLATGVHPVWRSTVYRKVEGPEAGTGTFEVEDARIPGVRVQHVGPVQVAVTRPMLGGAPWEVIVHECLRVGGNPLDDRKVVWPMGRPWTDRRQVVVQQSLQFQSSRAYGGSSVSARSCMRATARPSAIRCAAADFRTTVQFMIQGRMPFASRCRNRQNEGSVA